MKIAILLLVLCASAYSMRSLSALGDSPVYENPWTGDSENGKCDDKERLDKWTDINQNIVYATCMPIQGGNLGQCPRSASFDNGISNYNTVNKQDPRYGHNKHFCVEECSEAHDGCSEGAVCRPAPKYLMNEQDTVRMMCAYPKSTPPTPPTPKTSEYYESPWLVDSENGACNKKDYKNRFLNEEVYKHTDSNGKVWGMCMPRQEGDYSSCPVPPNFNLKLNAYDSVNSCFVECSDNASACPNGSVCLPAPTDIVSVTAQKYLKNVCMYAKPSNKVRLNMAYFQ